MGLYHRGRVWWIDFYDQKRNRIQESSHSSNRRLAEKLLDLRKGEVLRGVFQPPVKKTLAEFGDRYMEHAKANKRSRLRDQQMLGHLKEFFGAERQLSEVGDLGDNLVTIPPPVPLKAARLSPSACLTTLAVSS